MKGGQHIDGEMHLCEPVTIPQQKASRADTHFTLLGLELLTRYPLIYIFIFTDLRENNKMKMRVDLMTEEVGNIEDEDYALNNIGKAK